MSLELNKAEIILKKIKNKNLLFIKTTIQEIVTSFTCQYQRLRCIFIYIYLINVNH